MKKVLALVIALVLLVAMAPVALAAGTTVNVSVSVDGKLLVAAQPVTVTTATMEAVLKAAHKAFYSGGEAGYAAGIDKTYNMYLISKCWGVSGVPYIAQNDAMISATVDTLAVKAGDNIVICESSDTNVPATPISLKATVSAGTATVTATSWTLDFATFTYKAAPAANLKVTDGKTGALGTTDAKGVIKVAVPATGVIAVGGLGAISVGAPAAPATSTAPATSSAPATSTAPAAGTSSAPAATTTTGDTDATALPQTDGISTSTIIAFVGLALIAVGATMFVLRRKQANESI